MLYHDIRRWDNQLTESDFYKALDHMLADAYPHLDEAALEDLLDDLLDRLPGGQAEALMDSVASVAKQIGSGSLDFIRSYPDMPQGRGHLAAANPTVGKVTALLNNPQVQTALVRGTLGLDTAPHGNKQNGQVSQMPLAIYLRAIIAAAQAALVELEQRGGASAGQSEAWGEDVDGQAEWLAEDLSTGDSFSEWNRNEPKVSKVNVRTVGRSRVNGYLLGINAGTEEAYYSNGIDIEFYLKNINLEKFEIDIKRKKTVEVYKLLDKNGEPEWVKDDSLSSLDKDDDLSNEDEIVRQESKKIVAISHDSPGITRPYTRSLEAKKDVVKVIYLGNFIEYIKFTNKESKEVFVSKQQQKWHSYTVITRLYDQFIRGFRWHFDENLSSVGTGHPLELPINAKGLKNFI